MESSASAAGRAAPRYASVLFLCGKNAVRSPMAAAILRERRPDIYVASAGVERGEPDLFVATVLAEIGLDLADHTPHTLEDLGDMNFDLVVALTPEAREQADELVRTQAIDLGYWPFDDPTLCEGSITQRLEAYRTVRDGLRARILRELAA